ncbi:MULTISPECIES: acetyl-CoA decarbonylase/synthase complex subunit delta [Sporomusa]|jgi:acetyl-CoA decarbonylase/synthase complex subunit delta|uniref:Corrinoid/iron-sulfur protein small subunit n=1 Tax=Sporomusa sphaeroides DSM 2875 TaxID=1337886 RepID=A0ABP2CBB0_9FIRM|nr:acetyl-CoA decarbonylase/synthase complex subunit delta [Sporomusa sphaeroides]MCM0760691.1 acetyl-CoA decarbonylase/synthase complex subunit delta [Sporomusa sphaeroides DSM 2875]OLS57827.1 corrinoid/iron-sulfur protein small subunit [Sporomusa sphaeroides DSM 2875]CVK20958.1 Corrinoid/iron-sulfur protein small subunit [Sporomusa sphaeroides DSM 2875]HML34814.1 acetyl-CoA decarbonylase/synthase complex subunit delta [Sporomusa sphaeroides]
MATNMLKEKYTGKINTVTIGATKEQGGTRTSTVTVGGDATMPFLQFEGDMPLKPVVAMEIQDVKPDWHPLLNEVFADVMDCPVKWAKKCVECGADLIYLKLAGADPDGANKSPEDCAKIVKEVLAAVGVPLIVVGCGNDEKDNAVLPVVAEAAAGENLLIGLAEQDNYKSVAAAAMVHKHKVLAQSPLDINICKQLNILITELGLAADNIIIDPSTAALGYGIEYTYSILERGRLGALGGDKMLSQPVICQVGYEAWRAKEAVAAEADFPNWGVQADRAILWEAMTAAGLLQGGAHIMVLRHPEAVRLFKKNAEALMVAPEI